MEDQKLFKEEPKPKKEQQPDEFAQSCRPLSELLDSVRHIEGFPIAKDEDILALSDPPYYTACPNPYINDFIEKFGKPYDEATDTYERTPFVSDVSEGKNDPIYNAHSYHTKVPHKAIMKFIEHYTEEGDIVFDGFCGTGMTGVAAQLLNRRAILCDLSPAATFIAYNYNTQVDVDEFEREAKRILEEVEKECGWMYETKHTDGSNGKINYTVWSDVFICPYCNNEYIFWEAAVDKQEGKVNNCYNCPHCQAEITKKECSRATVTFSDQAIGQEVTQAKQVPVMINYTVEKKRYEKKPDKDDFELIGKIEGNTIPYWFPTNRMPKGYNTEQPKRSHGLSHVHQFYTKRNLWVLACLYHRYPQRVKSWLWLLGHNRDVSKLTGVDIKKFFLGGGGPMSGGVKGTLYIPSIFVEKYPLFSYGNRLKNLSKKLWHKYDNSNCMFSTTTTTDLLMANESVDYIFTDPPFGGNLMYSELNFLWEAWLKVSTNNTTEAIINYIQNKGLIEYKALMFNCFKEMYRIIKPNRWITIVFHNSKASIWNAIQDALSKAGFIVAQVTVMDKKQGSFKQVTSSGAVKNDLIINAYKPRKEFEEFFLKKSGEGMEKAFINEHLSHLPPEPNIERTEQMLYSKLLAHYVQRGFEIRLNAKQFYTLLKDNFKLIDGFWFRDDQTSKYEEWKKKHGLSGIKEIQSGKQVLFVTDEKTALVWLYHFLDTPKSYGDIYTASRKILGHVEDDIPELRQLLDNNFIFEDGCYRRPQDEKEKEQVAEQREKELARAFETILTKAKTSTRKIKEVRKEALTQGFAKAYQEKRFEDILTIAKQLDKKILETNSELNDFIEIAKLKIGLGIKD